jgi:hypothetical protein
MIMTKPQCLVVSVQEREIVVCCNDRDSEALLQSMDAKQLGGRRKPSNQWSLPCDGEERNTASLLTRLRDLGIPLAGGGSGWPPAAIFSHYREKGLVVGPFVEAEYWGPTKGWTLRER